MCDLLRFGKGQVAFLKQWRHTPRVWTILTDAGQPLLSPPRPATSSVTTPNGLLVPVARGRAEVGAECRGKNPSMQSPLRSQCHTVAGWKQSSSSKRTTHFHAKRRYRQNVSITSLSAASSFVLQHFLLQMEKSRTELRFNCSVFVLPSNGRYILISHNLFQLENICQNQILSRKMPVNRRNKGEGECCV